MILFLIFVLIGLVVLGVVRGYKVGVMLDRTNYKTADARRNGDVNWLDLFCMCLAFVILSPFILAVKLRKMWFG